MGEVEQNTFTEQMEHGKMKWLFFEFIAKKKNPKKQTNNKKQTNQPINDKLNFILV